MLCSAAYEMACHTSAIYAGRDHLVGSIGTRLHVFDYSQLFSNLGIKSVPIDTGPFKSTGAFGTELTEDQQGYLQEIVDSFQKHFSATVQAGRSLTDSELAAVATGRVWTGESAVGLKLIDAVQPLSATVQSFAASPRSNTQSRKKTMSENVEATLEETAASLKELKAAFPEASAEFREEQLEKGATMTEASIAYANCLKAELAAAQEAKQEAEEKAKQAQESNAGTEPKPAQRGNKPLSKNTEQQDGGSIDYRTLAKERIKETGCSFREACQWVVRRHGADAREAFKKGILPG